MGTGSVKQVNLARWEDNNEYAVAVLRANVEDEAESSLNALECSPEVGTVAARLGRLVFQVCDALSCFFPFLSSLLRTSCAYLSCFFGCVCAGPLLPARQSSCIKCMRCSAMAIVYAPRVTRSHLPGRSSTCSGKGSRLTVIDSNILYIRRRTAYATHSSCRR